MPVADGFRARARSGDTAGAQAYRRSVRTQQHRRPGLWRWIWYAFGGGLPNDLAPWVLADTTGRTWWLRHLARAVVQVSPLVVACLFVPVPLAYRLGAAVGGLLIGLIYSAAFITETTEHPVAKAGYPAGTAAQARGGTGRRGRGRGAAAYPQ